MKLYIILVCTQVSLKISNIIKPKERFSFNKVDQMQIENEILQLNAKKSAGSDAIPPKVVKDSFMVLNTSPNKIV